MKGSILTSLSPQKAKTMCKSISFRFFVWYPLGIAALLKEKNLK